MIADYTRALGPVAHLGAEQGDGGQASPQLFHADLLPLLRSGARPRGGVRRVQPCSAVLGVSKASAADETKRWVICD